MGRRRCKLQRAFFVFVFDAALAMLTLSYYSVLDIKLRYYTIICVYACICVCVRAFGKFHTNDYYIFCCVHPAG